MQLRSSAELSPCARYRYELRRVWDDTRPLVLFVGLNPSTADATEDDNTSRVCINYAKRWGYGGLLMANLFALRSVEPRALYQAPDPVGLENDKWLKRLQAEAALVVCAWGEHGAFMNRDQIVLGFLSAPHCLTILKSGRPGHPLYKSRDLRPIPLLTGQAISRSL